MRSRRRIYLAQGEKNTTWPITAAACSDSRLGDGWSAERQPYE